MRRNLPIALFDSGVGGLTVVKAVRELLERENLIYLGDTARVPYGTKSRETIVRYSLNAASKLMEAGAKMLVIACNTATSAALDIAREKFAPMPVIGVIMPGAQAAVKATRNGKIAVIGTEATIQGGAYQRAIRGIAPEIKVLAKACTLFVPLAEEGWLSGDVAESIARRYLDEIFKTDENGIAPDTLLLGCTHFPLLQAAIQKVVGPSIRIVDSAFATALRVKEELERLDLLRVQSTPAFCHFMTTDNPERFSRTGASFLGDVLRPEDVELVEF